MQGYCWQRREAELTQAVAERNAHVLKTALNGKTDEGHRGVQRTSKKALALAARCFAEWRAKERVAAANAQSGCAPAMQQACCEFLRSRACAEGGGGGSRRGAWHGMHDREAVRGSRWRNWAVRLGSLQLKEEITAAAKLAEAEGRGQTQFRHERVQVPETQTGTAQLNAPKRRKRAFGFAGNAKQATASRSPFLDRPYYGHTRAVQKKRPLGGRCFFKRGQTNEARGCSKCDVRSPKYGHK